MKEYIVKQGEHIATVELETGEALKVTFDRQYYYFYIYLFGGFTSGIFIKVNGEPETNDETNLPEDGTLRYDVTKGYCNTFHEFYSNSLYLLKKHGADPSIITIIGTNNKNVNQ